MTDMTTCRDLSFVVYRGRFPDLNKKPSLRFRNVQLQNERYSVTGLVNNGRLDLEEKMRQACQAG